MCTREHNYHYENRYSNISMKPFKASSCSDRNLLPLMGGAPKACASSELGFTSYTCHSQATLEGSPTVELMMRLHPTFITEWLRYSMSDPAKKGTSVTSWYIQAHIGNSRIWSEQGWKSWTVGITDRERPPRECRQPLLRETLEQKSCLIWKDWPICSQVQYR